MSMLAATRSELRDALGASRPLTQNQWLYQGAALDSTVVPTISVT